MLQEPDANLRFTNDEREAYELIIDEVAHAYDWSEVEHAVINLGLATGSFNAYTQKEFRDEIVKFKPKDK